MKHHIWFTIALLFTAHTMQAQDITGKLVDNNNQPLFGANVLLLSTADSTFITGTTTDLNGLFALATEKTEGILLFSYIGYHKRYYTLKEKNVGTIKLQEDVQALDMVTITGSRIINNARGYSIHPKGSGLENCNTAQEMFAFLPGMSISENKIKLLDKNPIIYVNGIKITSQDELAALQPKRIENIEVDYQAIGEGATEKSGVIRITTKKEKIGGYSGYLSAKNKMLTTYGYNEFDPTFVFDASVGRWTFNFYTLFSNNKLLEDAKYNYQHDGHLSTSTTSKTRSWMNYLGSRLNISYELNKQSTIAISEYIGNTTTNNRKSNAITTWEKDSEETVCSNVVMHGPERQFEQETVTKYILQTDDNGSRLEISADYLFRNYHFKEFNDENKVCVSVDSTMERTNMFRFSPNYTHKFASGKELKIGTDYQYIRYNDRTEELTHHADAHIPSAYANLSGIRKAMMYSAGLTLQYNRMNVRTAEETSLYEKFHVCPQANLMWMINPKRGTMLGFMYQCTVSDMPYSVINNYRKHITPFHYTTGNPSLTTPIEHEVMTRFTINKHIVTMLIYDREENPIYYAHGVDELNKNITWSKPENGKYRQLLGARIEFSYTPAKWWNTKFQAAAMQCRFASGEETTNGQWGGKFWWNNNFNFSPTFGGSLNGYWETKTSFENYYWEPVGHVNASLWKSLCHDRLRLSLQSTICAKGRKSRTEGQGYTSYYHNTTKPTSIALSLTWNFSGGKSVQKRSEAESTQQYKKIEEKK